MKFYTCDRSSTKDKAIKYFVTSKISENIHETPEGYLVCVGVPIARTGEMIYGEGETPLEVDDAGRVIIDRHEDEVFSAETIASFEGKSVTITHPTEFVNPRNWSQLTKGTLQNVRRGEGDQLNDLIADLLITDSVAINLVKNGLREVSCGYEAEYTQTGEGRGVQTNIVGNHLALVEQGRAGSAYAINDHKGKGDKLMNIKEKIKAIFAKAQDEAMKIADEEKDPPAEKKDDKAKDAGAYDELVKMVKDLGEKVSAMGKPKDEAPAEKKEEKKDDKKKDGEGADEEVNSGLEDRLKALEASVAKLLEKKAEEQSEDEGDLITDEDGDKEDKEEEIEDDDFEESTMTGDTASRVEILAPGMKPGKDAKVKALKTFHATKDGKKLIESLTGGKAPTFDAAQVETLFIAASEVLKQSRQNDLSKTKQTRDFNSALDSGDGVMTPEKMNELNAKHYKRN